ncbi:MAG: F0F1 ATP synthase subunit A [Streptosporangiales bacterium]|nr:F0F1 ATP synthase subunit A [Streptosporangiales bacterium]
MTSLLAAEESVIPHHTQVTVAGLTFNLDTIWSTLVAGAIVVALGLYMRSRITHGVPSKLQLLWEVVVEAVETQVRTAIGPVAPFVVPLAVTLFFFILIANYLELIPTMHYLPPPTGDVNLPAAMAVFVIVLVHVTGIRKRGAGNYFKHFLQPFPVMLPFNIVEEIAKPISLSLRLFGNIFASTIMLSVIAFLFPFYIVPVPNIAWKLFALFIGAMQAFIFALLTIIYFGFAVGGAEEEH